MRKVITSALFVLFATMAPASAQPVPALKWGSILIYQAELLDDVFPNENELTAYMHRLENAASNAFEAQPSNVSGVIFVAVKPDRRARVWILGDGGQTPAALKARLESGLGEIEPIRVRHDFLFGLTFNAGSAAPFAAPGPPPIPPEWEAQIPPQGTMLDDAFIDRVWP